jgi:glycosyltransferase involved in cell wall biosynthesis
MSARRPRVCIVDASIDVTGAFVSARAAATALAGEIDVVLVLPDNTAIPDRELAPFAAAYRLPIRSLRRTPASIATHLPALALAGARLARILADERVDVVQLNDFYLMHGTVARAFGFRGRVVTYVRMDPERLGAVLSRAWLQHACRTSDRVVAISAFVARRLPDGIAHTLVYDPVRGEAAPLDATRDADRVVCVGNYIRGKGQDDVVEAFARVAATFPRARLDFYGGDMGLDKNREFRDALAAAIRRHGLEDRVTLHGFARDVRDVFGGARIAVNFSHSEAFSLTCLEAAQHGCALIATRCGGPEEIVDDGVTGVLVDVADHAAMADALARLLRDPEHAERMGRAAAQRVAERFSVARFRAALREAYGFDGPHGR